MCRSSSCAAGLAGVSTELPVWAGGFHNFEKYAPNARLTNAACAALENWLLRRLQLKHPLGAP
jgi:hypothetical protein